MAYPPPGGGYGYPPAGGAAVSNFIFLFQLYDVVLLSGSTW